MAEWNDYHRKPQRFFGVKVTRNLIHFCLYLLLIRIDNKIGEILCRLCCALISYLKVFKGESSRHLCLSVINQSIIDPVLDVRKTLPPFSILCLKSYQFPSFSNHHRQ